MNDMVFCGGPVQHWEVFHKVTEIFILVPALLGLKGNLEMTLASRLSTAVSKPGTFTNIQRLCIITFHSWCETHSHLSLQSRDWDGT